MTFLIHPYQFKTCKVINVYKFFEFYSYISHNYLNPSPFPCKSVFKGKFHPWVLNIWYQWQPSCRVIRRSSLSMGSNKLRLCGRILEGVTKLLIHWMCQWSEYTLIIYKYALIIYIYIYISKGKKKHYVRDHAILSCGVL